MQACVSIFSYLIAVLRILVPHRITGQYSRYVQMLLHRTNAIEPVIAIVRIRQRLKADIFSECVYPIVGHGRMPNDFQCCMIPETSCSVVPLSLKCALIGAVVIQEEGFTDERRRSGAVVVRGCGGGGGEKRKERRC